MRAVVQRVASASVEAGGRVVGEIGRGLLVLVGVAQGDGPGDVETLAGKLLALRIFPDDAGLMNRSVVDIGCAVLVVSQFTLLGDIRRGRRPSFTDAAPPDVAAPLIDALVARLAAAGVPVATGEFGAQMRVSLVNEGPVTILVEVRDGKVV